MIEIKGAGQTERREDGRKKGRQGGGGDQNQEPRAGARQGERAKEYYGLGQGSWQESKEETRQESNSRSCTRRYQVRRVNLTGEKARDRVEGPEAMTRERGRCGTEGEPKRQRKYG